MRWIKQLAGRLIAFLMRRFVQVGRLLIGIFMIFIGLWFSLAPFTQQFATSDALQDAPYVWLIIPVGILQIAIGYTLLRPLWHTETKSSV
ncbi:MAG: hypothetical protein WBC91_06495 [Phototrophicaceae bacterium]